MARLALVAGIFIAGLAVGHHANAAPNGVDRSDLIRVIALIKSKFVHEDVSDEAMFYGSVKGVVDALDDPYSRYTTPHETSIENQNFTGKFAGIGAQLGAKEGHTVIVAPTPKSPAEKAGLKAGDVIVEVDGTSVDGKPVDEAVTRIRGDIGSKVRLKVYRKGESKTRDVTITREEIVLETPGEWKIEKKDGKRILRLTFSSFNKDGGTLFLAAAKAAMTERVEGIVLDLRGNPGGLVPVAQLLSCAWVSPNESILRIEPRGEEPEVFTCPEGSGFLATIPTVVLINGWSASASEIVAGALQDHGRARLIGEKTFGKGCGQLLFPLPDGSQLRLTTFLWKTPKGRTIHKLGITPDEAVAASEPDPNAAKDATPKDAQMDRALQYLTTGH